MLSKHGESLNYTNLQVVNRISLYFVIFIVATLYVILLHNICFTNKNNQKFLPNMMEQSRIVLTQKLIQIHQTKQAFLIRME